MTDPNASLWTSPFTRVTSAFAIALGGSVLLAWVVGHPTAPSILPERPPMLPDTAAGLILCGLALWLLSPPPSQDPGGRGRIRSALGRTLALIALCLGIGAFVQFIAQREQVLIPVLFAKGVRAYVSQAGQLPERSSLNELATLALSSLAILTLDRRIAGARLCRIFAVPLLGLVLVAFV